MPAQKSARLDAGALWDYAVKLLAGRAYSSGELRAKLRLKAQRAGDVAPVISRLKDAGYLDDRRYAQSFASARLENQGFGRRRVLRDLLGKRVAPAVASGTVDQLYREVDEPALIEDFLRRKYRRIPPAGLFEEDKDLAAAYRKLLRAGFSSGNILRVLKRFAAHPELLDELEPPEPAAEEP